MASACIFCKIIKGTVTPPYISSSHSSYLQQVTSPRSSSTTRPKPTPSSTSSPCPLATQFVSLPLAHRLYTLPVVTLTACQLVIPKHHGAKLTDIPDDHLLEVLSVLKKIATASGATDYNILQNNGRAAHQVVDHVHFHMIPKPNETEGLGIEWPMQKTDMDKLKQTFEDIKSRM